MKTIIKLHDNDPQEFKSVIRLPPEQLKALLIMISPVITHDDTFMRTSHTKARSDITISSFRNKFQNVVNYVPCF